MPRTARHPAPRRKTRRVQPADPCTMSRHLRRDIGLDGFPCPPSLAELRNIL
jgi:hypothetical protein